MADLLDDDFVPDGTFDDAHDDEDAYDSDAHQASHSDAEEPPLSAAPVVSDAANSKKRKRNREREKFKEKKRMKLAATSEPEPELPSARSPYELAEYLLSMQAKTSNKMSAIELEDLRIPADAIADTTAWTGPRTLSELPDFIAKVLPNLRLRLSQKSKTNGAPTLLFIAGAALRVADVCRVLKDKKLRGDKGGEVAKLFARHIKVAQQVSYLLRTRVGSAVGTPGRIGKLLEDDALQISALSHIILDSSFQDAKKRTLLDIPETRDEVFKVFSGSVLEGIKAGKIQVVLF
ncbi:Protein cms1 [Mycena kentingensis (nom. inval.)]|nr:Protein cms1 [Mycena kentingensis (nom. inval.)]